MTAARWDRDWMTLVFLAAWLGAAALVAAVVAPAAFAVLPSRALAGALVGRVLPVLFVAGLVVGLAVALRAGRGTPFWLGRTIAGAALALTCAVAQFGVTPRITKLRAEMGPSIEAVAPTDASRVTFGRLHAFSVALLGAGIVAAAAGLALTVLAARPPETP